MKIFLTSLIGGSYVENGIRIPCPLFDENQFLENLRKYWADNAKCLILSSSPDNITINDSFLTIFKEAFIISGFSLSKIDVCDCRNEDKLAEIIYDYDVLLLAGGHVPTQNEFFHRINLKELIHKFNGIIIGISAGSMNSAEHVYAQPELDEEVTDPNYKRYLDGLDLTKISILPHFQDLREATIGGLRALEDISFGDSKEKPFYALVDGSYVLIDDHGETFYGETYWIENETITKVCEKGECKQLTLHKLSLS